MNPSSGVQPCESRLVSSESQVHSTRSKMACASSIDVLVLKMLPAGENAAKQDRGIDRRNLRVPHSFAGVDDWRSDRRSRGAWAACARETRESARPATRASAWLIKPRFSPMQIAVSPKPVDAMLAARLVILGADVAAILDQARLRICLLPEEEKVGLLQGVEELVLQLRNGSRQRRLGRGFLPWTRTLTDPLGEAGCGHGLQERQAEGNARKLSQQLPPRILAIYRIGVFFS